MEKFIKRPHVLCRVCNKLSEEAGMERKRTLLGLETSECNKKHLILQMRFREREKKMDRKRWNFILLYTIEEYYLNRIPPRFFLLSKNLGQKSRLPSHYFYYNCEDVCKLYCCNLAACSRICYARYSSLDSQ